MIKGNDENGRRMVAGKHSWQEPGRGRRRASDGFSWKTQRKPYNSIEIIGIRGGFRKIIR